MEVWRDSWNTSVEYGEVFYRRATGELPVLAASKALALLFPIKPAPITAIDGFE